MTVPGVDATVALSIVAAVGDFTRFRTPEKLVAYLGLNPRVRQSGGQPASHGRITKAGSAHARGMLVEAAWSASKAAGPLRAFYQRVRARRGMQVAVVATARKLAVLCWHLIIKGEDYAFAQPSLVAHKRRKLELRAGRRPPAGRKGKRPATRSRPSAPPSATSPPRPRRPTAHGRRLAAHRPRSQPAARSGGGRGRQPTGRDYQGPRGAKRRGRAYSPRSCTSLGVDHAHHRPTLPRSSPGSRSSVPALRALHLDPGCGPAISGCRGGGQTVAKTLPAARTAVDISSVV